MRPALSEMANRRTVRVVIAAPCSHLLAFSGDKLSTRDATSSEVAHKGLNGNGCDLRAAWHSMVRDVDGETAEPVESRSAHAYQRRSSSKTRWPPGGRSTTSSSRQPSPIRVTKPEPMLRQPGL